MQKLVFFKNVLTYSKSIVEYFFASTSLVTVLGYTSVCPF